MNDISARSLGDLMSNDEIRAVFNVCFDGVAIVAAGSVIDANRALCAMFGYDSSELIGRSVLDLVAPESSAAVQRSFGVSDGVHQAVGLKKNGTRFHVELRGHVAQDSRWVLAIRDISRAHAAERELRASEDRLHTFAEMTSQYLCAWSIEPGQAPILDWASESFVRFTGRTIEQWRSSPSYLDIVSDEDRARAVEHFGNLMSGNETVGELRIRDKGGNLRALHVIARPIWDSDRTRVTAIHSAARDITDEDHVRESALLTEQILSGAHEGILVIDRDHRYRFWNPRMEHLTGVPKKAVLGQTPWDLFPFLRGTGLDVLLQRALQGEHVTSPDFAYEVPSTHQSGWAVQKMGPLRDHLGQITAALVFVEDITDRRQNEETIQRQLAEISSYYAHAPVGLGVLSTDLRFLRINDALAAMNGLPAADHIGKHVREIVPALEARVASVTSTIVRTGEPVVDVEVTGETAKEPGVSRTWLGGWYPVRDSAGEIRAFTVIVQDITERKRREEERQQLQAQLAHSQKMDAIGNLAGGVAHDFNNLLTVILVSADAAVRSLQAGDALRDTISEIQQAGERAASLTRQLLAFGRKQVRRPVPLDLNTVVRDTVTMVRRLITANIEIGVSLDPELGLTVADVAQIEVVIVNLVVNARDAMPSGGRITIATANVGPSVVLTVSDTGKGMDEETRSRCFEPFFTTKDVGKGTGLGLSTTYGIVHQSGGTIEVTSQPGRGTTFTISLPRATELAVGSNATARGVALARGETILVVDDEPALLKVVTRILRAAGYVVFAATNGSEALRTFNEHNGNIDLVVTDVMMPDMDGRALVEQLKQTHSSFRVVLMSGYADSSTASHATSEAFIGKPFLAAELLHIVRQVLDADRR